MICTKPCTTRGRSAIALRLSRGTSSPHLHRDPHQAAIQNLQKQLAEQNAKVEALAAQKNNQPAAAPAAAAPTEEQLKLQLQLAQNQKELEALKAAK